MIDFGGLAAPMRGQAHIVQHHLDLEKVLDRRAPIEKLAEGFEWAEGPVWVDREGGFLLFTDVPANRIYRWRENRGVDVFLAPSGYTGDVPHRGQMGANGLLLDHNGDLLICQHGDRRVARYGWDDRYEAVASHYQGNRFHSPNDLDIDADGTIYFTDPPYGLPWSERERYMELDFNGVYKISRAGEVTLLDESLTFPNGIGLSPDGKTLYVNQSDREEPVIFAYDVKRDGTVENKRIFYDFSATTELGSFATDGLTIDEAGNVWTTSPLGVSIINPQGTLLGTIVTRKRTANCTFGGPDKSHLFITADDLLLRVPTRTGGK